MATCYRCENERRETTYHTIRFDDDRDPKRKPLCGPCARILREQDNAVRSIT